MKPLTNILPIFIFFILFSCGQENKKEDTSAPKATDPVRTSVQDINLAQPYATKSVKVFSKVIGWPEGKTPIAPRGFSVNMFADGLNNPRFIYTGPNGDIFVAESNTEEKTENKIKDNLSGKSKSEHLNHSANRITILRDADRNGTPEIHEIFLTGLHQPFGMLILGKYFYVACTDALWRYPYQEGSTKITKTGKKILDLPGGGYNNHWTRNIISNANGRKIYVSIGSGSNVAEHGMDNERGRANIIEINLDGTGYRVFASGLRNPVGMAWSSKNELWTAVNERDELGDDLVPDYITSVKENGFYGWPYSYLGQHLDPRIKEKDQKPGLVKSAIVPDVLLDAHSASLGLAINNNKYFFGKYSEGAFVGQHGSWNRSKLSGYKIIFIPMKDGRPSGKPEDFLTGFIADSSKQEVYGRPVGVSFLKDGSMLVADDAGNKIWRILGK